MYLSGEGVEKDENKAVTYFMKGAEKGMGLLFFPSYCGREFTLSSRN